MKPPTVAEHASWAVLLISREHKREDARAGSGWTCACRCCEYARYQMAAVKAEEGRRATELHPGRRFGH